MQGASGPAVREDLTRALAEDGDRLYGLALRVTRDPALAQDAVQDAFMAALEKADAFRGEAAITTWLYRIVYTKAIDLLRRRARETGLADESAAEPGREDERLGGSASWNRPPDELLLGQETHAVLEQALGALTPIQRAVFELRQLEELPTDEVGQILGMPPGTVRVHLHRGRLRLRELMASHFERTRA